MTCSTTIHLEFIKVAEGETFLVTIPCECDREEFARILRHYLSNGDSVLVDTYVNHDSCRKDGQNLPEDYDDPIDMLINMTDPGMFVSLDDCREILSEAEANGWHIDPKYTPKDIYDMYYDLEPEEEE